MKNFLDKLQPIFAVIRKYKKPLIVLVVLGFGLFMLIALRGGSEVKLGPIDVNLPSFKNEESRNNTPLEALPNFLQNTNLDDVESTNPDIVITEDTSDPDEYKRNGLEGSGEIVMVVPDNEDMKISDEINEGKRGIATGMDFLLNKHVSDKEALSEKNKLQNRIPLYINNFGTSNKKELNIAIYSGIYDPEHVLRVEISGIDYQNSNVSDSNPEMVAFREAFNRAKSELISMGVDVKKLHILFGSRGNIAKTATNWVVKLGLLN